MATPRVHSASRTPSDSVLILSTAFICALVYISLSIVLGSSQIPILVIVFICTNMLSRTGIFKNFVSKLDVSKAIGNQSIPRIPSVENPTGHKFFESISEHSRIEILSAIKSLQAYSENTKNVNDRRRRLFKMMTWRQQKLCEDVGYLKKLAKIDQSISYNQKILSAIADGAVKSFGISYKDFDLLRGSNNSNTSSTNYRVIEALGHYIRDWSPDGDAELKPMMNYITEQLNRVIPVHERLKTCVIIPGLGLGRIAHEIASVGTDIGSSFGAVHAIEYSGLMHLCNQFIYSSENEVKDYDIFPYVHSCSNFIDSSSQFRSSVVHSGQNKPENLALNHEDFRYFEIPNKSLFENVVVVSAFFIDTAENLVTYLDTIQELTTPSRRNDIKNGYWINIGPLKYGTAAQVELNSDELKKIRKAMGWKDLNSINSLNSSDNQLVGYMTDKQSMWQGYYGLTMWNTGRKENSRK